MPQRPDFSERSLSGQLLAVGIPQRKEAGSVPAPVDFEFWV